MCVDVCGWCALGMHACVCVPHAVLAVLLCSISCYVRQICCVTNVAGPCIDAFSPSAHTAAMGCVFSNETGELLWMEAFENVIVWTKLCQESNQCKVVRDLTLATQTDHFNARGTLLGQNCALNIILRNTVSHFHSFTQ